MTGRPRRGINVVGADANNLQFVDVEFPSPGVTLISGASGSGKSSLLADTLAAEGGRRNEVFLGVAGYEKMATSAAIGALPPSLYVGQRAFRATARTTVATATGLLMRLRRLFLRHAKPWAEPPGELVPEPTPQIWAQWLSSHARGSVRVWAVPLRLVASDGRRAVARLADAGITEFTIRSETDRGARSETGRMMRVSAFRGLDPNVRHTIEVCVGQFAKVTAADAPKLLAALEQAFEAAAGHVIVELPDAIDPVLLSEFGPRLDSEIHRLHPASSSVFRAPDRHLLSFNAPEHHGSGACGTCRGIGRATTLDEAALIAQPSRSMHNGAFSLWTPKNYRYVNIQHDTVEGLRGLAGFDPDKPWAKLPEGARRLIIEGWPEPVRDADRRTGRPYGAPRLFEGFREAVLSRVSRGSVTTAARLEHLVRQGLCPSCGGSRWSRAARALRVGDLTLVDALAASFDELPILMRRCAAPSSATHLVSEISRAAVNLSAVGLGHLTASRGMTEVSSGEARRLRLAGALNAPIDDLLVLLDEPARGLHEEDIAGLASAIRQLSASHTVVVSDHRRGLLAAADLVIDMGDKGGPAGGRIHQQGRAAAAGRPLIEAAVEIKAKRRSPSGQLVVRHANMHSLRDVSVDVPLGQLVCITGISGSGKSSFVRGILVPGLARVLDARSVDIEDFDTLAGATYEIEGAQALTSLVALDQQAPPPNRRSLLATFLDLANDMRAAYAAQPAAKHLDLAARDFGLNAGTGRCARCDGLGEVGEGAHAAPCPECGGLRFGPAALSVEIDELDPAAFLDLAIASLVTYAPDILPKKLSLLTTISELGLSYLSLGRRVDTLSGGEIQRLRIARALTTAHRGGTLFVLDEPAAGLHPVDVERLLGALERMLDGGRNSVVLVEHNPAIIARADHLIELGPGSGPKGGTVVARGSPRVVSKTKSATGRLLRAKGTMPQALPRPSRTKQGRPEVEGARNARDWLRILVGDDIEPPEHDPQLRDRFAVCEQDHLSRPLLDVGGLDFDIATLLLEVHQDTVQHQQRQLLVVWATHPAARLQIVPGLHEMRTWGMQLPKSCRREVHERLATLGLTVLEMPRGSRAQGDLLQPSNASDAARVEALHDGLAIGAGYVELVDGGDVLVVVSDRLVDFSRGIVGPRHPGPLHFLRTDLGACSACGGSAVVEAFDERLLIGSARSRPGDDNWLSAEAAVILKGIRRSELNPFLVMMNKEELFDASARYADLSEDQRSWLLHGYWRRPGPGTFLRKGKDPSEVGSWLRWDGLFRQLSAQLSRSKHERWRKAIEASRRSVACPECNGSGVGPTAELFTLAGRTLREHLSRGTAKTLAEGIQGVPCVNSDAKRRHELRRQRILRALLAAGSAPLHPQAPPSAVAASALLREVAHDLTTMAVIAS